MLARRTSWKVEYSCPCASLSRRRINHCFSYTIVCLTRGAFSFLASKTDRGENEYTRLIYEHNHRSCRGRQYTRVSKDSVIDTGKRAMGFSLAADTPELESTCCSPLFNISRFHNMYIYVGFSESTAFRRYANSRPQVTVIEVLVIGCFFPT
jgi:hypothetical protein